MLLVLVRFDFLNELCIIRCEMLSTLKKYLVVFGQQMFHSFHQSQYNLFYVITFNNFYDIITFKLK